MPTDDYILRSDALEAMMTCRSLTGVAKLEAVNHIMPIPAADVEPKRKWISVTKSLPKQSGVYRVCGHRRGSPMESWECEFWILSTMNGGGWLNEAGRPCVDYWLPKSEIPELPKEEDDDC